MTIIKPNSKPITESSPVLTGAEKAQLGTIKQFRHGSSQQPLKESIWIKESDKVIDKGDSGKVIVDIKKELYGIPAHLNVDKVKQNQSTYFADRTAMHIKTGLSEVEIEKREEKE